MALISHGVILENNPKLMLLSLLRLRFRKLQLMMTIPNQESAAPDKSSAAPEAAAPEAAEPALDNLG